MIIHDVQQNTDEWIALKLGKFSASSCADLLMKPDTKGYQGLIRRIVEERITGKPAEGGWKGNKFTERGHELEPIAIQAYELETFNKVTPIGFVERDENSGCSPDGWVGFDTSLQVKNPIFSTQLDYLQTQDIPGDYYKQMQFELWVCEREKNIFYSYHPHLPSVMLLATRDEKMIKEIETRLQIAIEDVEKQIKQIKERL
jgi:hypothetical protein